MKNHELDNLLRSKLDRPSQIPGGVWEQIEDKLDVQNQAKASLQKGAPTRKVWLLAASVLAVCAITGTLILSKKDAPGVPESPIAQTQDVGHHSDIVQAEHQDEYTANKSNPTIQKDLSSMQNIAPDHKVAPSTTSSQQHEYLRPIRPIADWERAELHLVATTRPFTDLASPLPWKAHLEEPSTPSNSIPETSLVFSQIKDADKRTFEQPTSNEEEQNVSYGMSGAYNYGSLKNGSTVALTTRRPLNERFFIDGSVGIVMNNSSPYQANFKGDFIAFKREPQRIASASSNLFTNSDAFYFVQINPSIGINVGPKMDFSLGTDYQQMLTNRDADVVMFQQSKLLPKHDFGLTGKTEFEITEHLKAGLLYREGITPLLNNNNTISSRRYLQVMLKLQIWKKKKKSGD